MGWSMTFLSNEAIRCAKCMAKTITRSVANCLTAPLCCSGTALVAISSKQYPSSNLSSCLTIFIFLRPILEFESPMHSFTPVCTFTMFKSFIKDFLPSLLRKPGRPIKRIFHLESKMPPLMSLTLTSLKLPTLSLLVSLVVWNVSQLREWLWASPVMTYLQGKQWKQELATG